MGRGIAVEFRRRWPAMYLAYRQECLAGRFKPGGVFVWEAADKTIFNLATQSRPGPHARLDFIETSLTKAVRIAEELAVHLIAMPRIGAGYGGLDWSQVRKRLEKVAASTEVVLAVYELTADQGRTATPVGKGGN
jgi:O-acetyl-ADP-ribose deacetylase (regulator of RNase III)